MKALYRRALCYRDLQQYDLCLSDLKLLFQIDGQNVQARQLADEVMQLIESQPSSPTLLSSTNTTNDNNSNSNSSSNKHTSEESSLELTLARMRQQALSLLQDGNITQAITICNQYLNTLSSSTNNNNTNNNKTQQTYDSAVKVEVDDLSSVYNILITCHAAGGNHREVVNVCSLLLSLAGNSNNFRGLVKRADAYFHLVCISCVCICILL